MKVAILDPTSSAVVYRTDEPDPTLFIRGVPEFAAQLKAAKKSVVFVGDGFAYGLSGNANPKVEDDLKGPNGLLKFIESAEEKRKADKAAAEKKKAEKQAAAAAKAGKDQKGADEKKGKGKEKEKEKEKEKDKAAPAPAASAAAAAGAGAGAAAPKAPTIKTKTELAVKGGGEAKAAAGGAKEKAGDGKQAPKAKGGNKLTDIAEFQITNLPGDVKDAVAFFVSKGYTEASM